MTEILCFEACARTFLATKGVQREGFQKFRLEGLRAEARSNSRLFQCGICFAWTLFAVWTTAGLSCRGACPGDVAPCGRLLLVCTTTPQPHKMLEGRRSCRGGFVAEPTPFGYKLRRGLAARTVTTHGHIHICIHT